MGPASSANWLARRKVTSSMRLTVREFMSALNSASRNTVKPSLSDSWNQSRQVTRLPDQLWKYSWATTDSTRWKAIDRKSTRLNSSHVRISYAVFCLKKKRDQKGLIL